MVLAVAANLIFGRDIPAPDLSDLELESISIPDDVNAYTYFIATTNTLHMPRGARELLLNCVNDKEVDETSLKELFEHNEATFAGIRHGLKYEKCIHPSSAFLQSDEVTSHWLWINHLLIAKTRLQRNTGAVSNAVDTLGVQLAFSDRIGEYPDSLLGALVGRTLRGKGLRQARDIARDERATPADLDRMAEILAALKPPTASIIRAWKGEFRSSAGLIEKHHSGTLSGEDMPGEYGSDIESLNLKLKLLPRVFFKPNETKKTFADAVRCGIADTTLVYAEMKSPAFDESMRKDLSRRMNRLILTNAMGVILARTILPPYVTAVESQCMAECDMTATLIVVACRRYRLREGVLPAKLEDLVPDFLQALPRDPYDGKPFRYDPGRETIWAVGKDLLDSDGSSKMQRNPRNFHDEPRDVVYRLSGPVD
jgi:hypothetical protein